MDRRFYAFAVDRAVAWGVDVAAAVLIVRALGTDQVWAAVGAIAAVVLVVGGVLAVVLGLTGSSPGSLVTSTRVVREDSGGPIGVSAALLRQPVLGVATLPTLGIGLAALAWTVAMDPSGRRRGWHDHLVGSVVVDVRPAPAEEPDVDLGPRHVVNLTAMRLVPVPESAPAPRVARPASPPPAPPVPVPVSAPAPAARHAAAVPAPAPAPAPQNGRQQLGFPLVPEPRPDAEPAGGGAHAAPRPQQWRLGFDTGESVVVDGPVLVGRRPAPRDGEQVAHLVPLPSDDMSLSKTHALVHVTAEGTLVVVDRGSTNGSILIRHGVPRGLAPDRAATLLAGDRVRLGDREMLVEPVH
nr:RDD family protein [Nocardioides sp. MAH-18]